MAWQYKFSFMWPLFMNAESLTPEHSPLCPGINEWHFLWDLPGKGDQNWVVRLTLPWLHLNLALLFSISLCVHSWRDFFFNCFFVGENCARKLPVCTCDESENCIKKSLTVTEITICCWLYPNTHILAHPWPTKSPAPPFLLSFISHYIPLCFFALKLTGLFQFLKGNRLYPSQNFSQCMPSACYHFPH